MSEVRKIQKLQVIRDGEGGDRIADLDHKTLQPMIW